MLQHRSGPLSTQERYKNSGYIRIVKRFNVVYVAVMDLTPLQCRMGRAALGLSINDLASIAGVRAMTLSGFERGGNCYASTIAKLQGALENHGVEFVAGGFADASGRIGVLVKL